MNEKDYQKWQICFKWTIDKKGDWLRSSAFGFNDYKDSSSLEIVYICENIQNYKNEITKNLYNFLITDKINNSR